MTDIPVALPLTPAQLRGVLVGLMLGLFLAALDQTVVAVALPDIARDLPGNHLLAWVVSAYLLAMTVSTPIFGKLGGVLAIIQALIGDLIAPAERGRYQAWFSGMFPLASLIGPPLGGLLSNQWSWRWVFWINLPLGLLAFFLSQRCLAGLHEQRRKARIDYLGCVLLILGLGSLLLLISHGGQHAQWLTTGNGLILLLAVVGLTLFIVQQQRSVEPLIPLDLLRIPAIRSGWLLLFFANFQAVGLAVLIPMNAHSAYGTGTGASQLMALAFGAPLGAYLGGRVSARLCRYKPMIVAGTLFLPPTLLVLALVPSFQGIAVLGTLLLCGAALGLQFPTSLVAVQSAAPSSHLGVATGVCGMFRGLGGALGVALLTSLLWQLLPGLNTSPLPDAGAALPMMDASLLREAFTQLLLIDAAIALLPLLIALRLEDRVLSRDLK